MTTPSRTIRPARRGFIILAVLGVAGIVVFNLQNIRDLTRPQINVVALVKDAPGVRVGTGVWAEGVAIGRVKGVTITKRWDTVYVALDLRMDARATSIITANSDVRASRQRFIGDPVIRLFAGAPGDPALLPGDTLIGVPRPTPEQLLDQAMALPPMLDSLVAAARTVQAQVDARQPDIERMGNQVRFLTDATAALAVEMDGGSLGRMLDGQTGVAARLGALRARVADLGAAAGRMTERYSPRSEDGLGAQLDALTERARRVEAAVGRLQTMAEEGEGFVARIQADTAIHVAIRGIQMQLDSLMDEAFSIALRMLLP